MICSLCSGSSARGPWAEPSRGCSSSVPRWWRRSPAGDQGSPASSSKKGDFENLSRSHIVVSLIGGTRTARDYVTRRCAVQGRGRGHAQATALAQHGEELVAAAREGGAQASLRPRSRAHSPGPVVGEPRRDPDEQHLRDRQRDDQLTAPAASRRRRGCKQAQDLLDPSDDRRRRGRRGEDGDPGEALRLRRR